MGASETVTCRQCGGQMARTTRTQRNYGLQVLAAPLCLLGLAVAVTGAGMTVAATRRYAAGAQSAITHMAFDISLGVAGLFLAIGVARLGHKKQDIWRCPACGYFFERA